MINTLILIVYRPVARGGLPTPPSGINDKLFITPTTKSKKGHLIVSSLASDCTRSSLMAQKSQNVSAACPLNIIRTVPPPPFVDSWIYLHACPTHD